MNKEATEVLFKSMHTISKATKNCVQFLTINDEDIANYPKLKYINISSVEGGKSQMLFQ